MVKIWYSVQGDGMGHAARSHSIMQHLSKEHELFITTTQIKPYNFLKSKYGDCVHLIEGDILAYEDNEVKFAKLLKDFFKTLPKKSKNNFFTLIKLVHKYNPDIIISDFEPAADYFSKLFKIPSVSIDNVHILSECKVKFASGSKHKIASARTVIKALHPKTDYFIIPSFADVIIKKPKTTFLVKPILREEVFSIKSTQKDFVLVYQTTDTNKKMLSVLKNTKNNYKIYGMGIQPKDKNLEFFEFNDRVFLKHLSEAKYVVVNGGFTVISEAIYLKKPILAVPIKKQYEQEFNGFSLRDRGFGDYSFDLINFDFDEFEKKLPFYRDNLQKYGLWTNDRVFVLLDKLINKMIKNKPNYKVIDLLIKNEV